MDTSRYGAVVQRYCGCALDCARLRFCLGFTRPPCPIRDISSVLEPPEAYEYRPLSLDIIRDSYDDGPEVQRDRLTMLTAA